MRGVRRLRVEREPECRGRLATRMSMDAAHKSWWQISEVVFGVPFLAAIGLQLAVPLAFPFGFLTPVVIAGGAALIIVGVALVVLARREFAQRGQPTDPGHPTSQVVTTGVFSVSRNPIYLGAACFLTGIALALNLPWVLVLLLPALVACHYVLIAPEERYLAAKFGEEYRMYTAAVQRWLGRARRLR
jgi:protein-S-isoprenylcysteine O-methyltransferase Ste14